jgi:hypothetical protein
MMIRWKLLALGILAAAIFSIGPAAAATYGNCYWDGTYPICAGSCRPGFVVRKSLACFSGYKVYCCEKMGFSQQSQKKKKR